MNIKISSFKYDWDYPVAAHFNDFNRDIFYTSFYWYIDKTRGDNHDHLLQQCEAYRYKVLP